MRIEIHRHPGTPDDTPTLIVTNTSENQNGLPSEFHVKPEGAARVVLREVFSGVTAITADGEVMAFNMRDSGFECVYQCGEHIESFSLQRGEIGWEMFPKPKPARLDEHRAMDLLETAWGIIANAGGGNWETQSAEWRTAAEGWRDGYHDVLDNWTHP